MDVLLFALNLAWKILALCMGWMLFKYVVRNGSGTFKELLDTVSVALRTFGHWIRKTCLNYLKKESAEAGEEPVPVEEVQTDKTDNDGTPTFMYLNYEDFKDAVLKHKPFILK